MKTSTRIPILTAAMAGLALLGVGCISVGAPSGNASADGGLFKSADKAETWAMKSAIPTVTGERRSFTNANLHLIVQDPQDPNALYVGTSDNGMYYSFDGGESWLQPKDLVRGRVWSIAVHPKNKCIVYATYGNKLLKSIDCTRSWTAPYIDSRPAALTKAVAIDSYNPNIVWLAMSTGDLLRSADNGDSWENVHNFNADIARLFISPTDTRRLMVATPTTGLWRSDDSGANWKDLRDGYKDYTGATEFLDWSFGVSDPNQLVVASKYGLTRSRDMGDTWDKIDLLTPPGQSLIYSLAIDPKDANSIYYGTATTFNKSSNGGQNWVTKRLPTSRAATVMKVDQANSSVIWMGVTKFKQ